MFMSHFPEPPNDLFKDLWFIVSIGLRVNLLQADASEVSWKVVRMTVNNTITTMLELLRGKT